MFDKLTTKAEKVLEIGIGTGPNMRYFAARNINVTLFGLDPNPKAKKYARKSATKAGLKTRNFRFKQGVGEAIPLNDNSVDAVVATLVLCSVSDVTQTLKGKLFLPTITSLLLNTQIKSNRFQDF